MMAGRQHPGGAQRPRLTAAAGWRRVALLALAGLVLAADASAWCNIGASCNKSWSYRRKLLLNSNEGATLDDFPVLVVLTAPGRIDYSKTQSLGQDVRFVDSDDATLLNHEIEKWTPGGTSYVWVRVPQVTGGTNTDFIWMYYGNPTTGPLPPSAAENTWDGNFRMVQHLEEQSGAHLDSTSFNTDSTYIDPPLVPTQGTAAGQIDGTDTFVRSGGPGGLGTRIEVVDNGSLDMADGDSFTVEAWVRTSWTTQYPMAFSKESRGIPTDGEIQIFANGGTASFWLNDGAGNLGRVDSAVNIADNVWHYVVGRWNNGTGAVSLWVDGLNAGSAAATLGAITTSTPGVIGDEGDASDPSGDAGEASWDGLIDEVRVSKTFRSNGWVRAQNRSMRDNGFVTFGAEAAHCCSLGVTELASDAGAGGAHTITVNGPTRFDIRFNEALGAGVDRFFDMEEATSTDLAGGDAPGMQPALFTDEINGNVTTGENTQGAELDLLEVTAARVKVRQEAFFQENASTNITPGLKGYGDYSIYGIGRLALGWERQATLLQSPAMQQLQWTVRYTDAVAPLDQWRGNSETLGAPATSPFSVAGGGTTAGDNFVLTQSEQPNARTDFLAVLYQDWGNANETFFGSNTTQNWEEASWIDNAPAAPIPVGSERVNFLTYFKPTTLASGGVVDAAVTSRSNDYRTPSTTTVTAGAGWVDLSENTAADPANVFFNEAEAAYAFDLSQATGLTFAMDGSTTTRHYPFFKIRQWRSFIEVPVVTFDPDGPGGVAPAPLVRNTQYRAAVKPVARAHFAQDLTWHSTLQSSTAVDTNPQVGSPGTRVGADFPTGRFGNGAQFNANDEYLYFPAAGNFSPTQGAIEFWYKPAYDYGAHSGIAPVAGLFGFWIDAQHYFYAYHQMGATANEGLRFQIGSNAGNLYQTAAGAGASFPQYWRASEWVHLRFVWKRSPAPRLEIYVNGKLASPAPAGVYTVDVPPDDLGRFHIGDRELTGSFNEPASGIIDEFYVYGQPDAPGPLAHGGLTTDPTEYLYDSGDNFSLVDFDPVGALSRGEYLYFGADAEFRGLNVSLATTGTGVGASAVLWEYWDGVRWSSLPGVTDQTNSFTKSQGTIFWTDPASWAVYSVNGGPDLYYVRALLTGGVDYTIPPVERWIKTDILLFQYCNDVTAANQTFAFAVPWPTTEVRLESFTATPGDTSVLLEWRTASELSNLGFHVYRGLSENGPWARLTSSLIPGLGSSAVGQAYSFRDTGLRNGTRYFYRLEDVDASSKTTSHGPASAVPKAGASADEGGGRPGHKKNPSSASCPDWVLSAYGGVAGADVATASLRCTRHGDPEAVSLGVLSRDSRQATLELRTGGFYALHEPAGTVRVFVPGFDFPQDEMAAALPIRRALTDAVVGRRVQLGGVRALDLVSFKDLAPSSIGRAEMQVGRDGTVRAARRGSRPRARPFPKSELVTLLPSLFQGEQKSAVVEIAPLRFDTQRRQLVLAKRVRLRLLFTGREIGESGRGSQGRAQEARKPAVSREIRARLYTTSRGLHAASFEQLFPGSNRGITASQLRLERQGEPVGFHVEPSADSFGPGSRLFFFADTVAASTDFSAEVAYELVGPGDAVQMPLQSAAPGSTSLASPSIASRSFETNRLYQPGLLESPDPWLWEPLASGVTRTKSFSLWGVTGSGTAELVVDLQGASESGELVDHHVSVSLNGAFVGEGQFAGRRPNRLSLRLPASLLREGPNDLSLTNVPDTGVSSLVFLDRFGLEHPQASSPTSGVFEGTWSETGTVSVSGFTAAPVLLDVTESARWISGYQASGGSLRFRAEAGHRYLAVSQEALLAPRIAAREGSTLRATTNQADYLLIAPRAFLAAAEPLVERRSDQGLAARAVSLEEIASEFGYGQPTAEAIKSFLAYAFHSWARPSPRYVLLLGDASYDPRNFSGTAQPSPLPALWAKTSYLWTVSDPQLAAVNGEDSLPDLAIGRLPAATVEQAEALVAKLLAWEASGQGLAGQAALVADNPDVAGDFEADVQDVATSFLAGRHQLLLLRELGAETRPAILDALNSGLSFLSYVGHGGSAVWASENVWNSWDAPSLTAQSQQPLLVTMNCLNGYFVAPTFDSLAESLLKVEGRGAIASFSPSGLSLDGPAHQYHRALMAELTSTTHARLGDAILAAQKTYAGSGLMPELLGVYHLLGDPATRIR